jgi:hypothetical protein
MDEQYQYNNKIKIIKKLIATTYPNDTFIFENFNNTFNEKIKEYTKIIINNNSSITILPDNTWIQIERNINVKLNNTNNTKECIICMNNSIKTVSCNKCSNYWCILCYIELFKKKNGIIICPFCRFSFGKYTPDYMMDICIDEIKIKSGI